MEQATFEISASIVSLLGPPLEPGDVGSVGGYRLIESIGQGGMGVVYRGRKVGADIDRAVKVLSPNLTTSDKARQRFLREAALTADLTHERLTGLIDLGEVNGLPYLVMPLLRGETLEHRLKREPVSNPDLIVQVARETAEGLAFAHDKGIVHRDIKPSNLWLESDDGSASERPHIKILDLGLALRMDEDVRVTSTGIMLGTPEYMAPERVRGENGDVRSDLFSLGCVLYRMATGSPPFPGANFMAVLRSLALVNPKPPIDLNPAFPRGLSDFIMALIAKDPLHRPAKASDVCIALERIDEYRATARTARPGSAEPLPIKKPRSRALILAAIAVVVAVGLSFALSFAGFLGGGSGVDVGPAPVAVIPRPKEPVVEPRPSITFKKDGELTNADLFGTVRPKSYARVHIVPLNAEKTYRIDLTSKAFDAYLWLEGPDGTFLKGDDDSGGSQNARLIFQPPVNGDYRLIATSFDPGKTGKFVLTVKDATKSDILRIKMMSFNSLDEAGRTRLLDEILAFIDGNKSAPTREGGHLAIFTARTLDNVSARDVAEWCDKLSDLLAPSRDEAIKAQGRIIAGIARRQRLPGADLEISGATLDGGAFDWTRYRGKYVLVDFWASTNSTSKAELLLIKRFYQAYKESGFDVVGVNVDRDAEAAVQFAKAQEIPWPSIHEKKATPQPLEERYGITGTPFRFLVDPKGKVIATRFHSLELTKLLKQHIGNPTVSLRTWKGHAAGIMSVAVSDDGKRIASGGNDNTVKAWDPSSDVELHTLKGHTQSVKCVAISGDGRRIVSGSFDGTVKVWQAAAGGEPRLNLTGHTGPVSSVAITPDGARIASGGYDGVVRVWNVVTGASIRELKGHNSPISQVAISGDGKRIVSGDSKGTIKVWDGETGQESHSIKGGVGMNTGLALSRDGKRLVNSTWDGKVILWDAETGAEIASLKGHSGGVWCVGWSGDGSRIVTAGADQSVQIWDAMTGTRLVVLMGHDAPVMSAALNADGSRVVTGSLDKTVRVWNGAAR